MTKHAKPDQAPDQATTHQEATDQAVGRLVADTFGIGLHPDQAQPTDQAEAPDRLFVALDAMRGHPHIPAAVVDACALIMARLKAIEALAGMP